MDKEMELSTNDLGLKSALETVMGHPVPFTIAELKALDKPLLINGARDLSLLQYCSNLRHLEIFASEIENLDALSASENLLTLKVICSTTKNIQELRRCRMLENLELICTLVEDLSPLMDLPRLRRAVLLGNPWTPESYHQLRQELLTKPVREWKKPPIIEFSNTEDWELTRELQNRGLQACFTHIDGDRPVLVKPGIASMQNSDCDFISLPDWLIQEKLELPNLTTESLFDSLLIASEKNASSRSFDFSSHRTLGDSDDAAMWVEKSSLTNHTKELMLQFVRHFKTLTFYKEDATFLDRIEEDKEVKLPIWLREIRETLAFVHPDLPDYEIQVQFGQFDASSNHPKRLEELWYRLNLRGYSNHEEREMLQGIEGVCLFPIGFVMHTEESALAINLSDPSDLQVYEYNIISLYEEAGGSYPLSALVNVAFNSYAEMFAYITALKLESPEVIEAR